METITNKLGSTKTEEINARKIIIAVSCPKLANIGIGANPIIIKPAILEIAEPKRAIPVPFRVLLNAVSVLFLLISSLNL